MNEQRDATGRLPSVPTTAGRLISTATFDGATATQTTRRGFTYDALGNLLTQTDPAVTGAPGAVTMTYQRLDRDRICSIAYGTATPPAACNVAYDGMGNIISEPSRAERCAHVHILPQRPDPEDRQRRNHGHLRLRCLRQRATTGCNQRDFGRHAHDKHFGSLIYRRDSTFKGTTESVIDRLIPGPGGLVAMRQVRTPAIRGRSPLASSAAIVL